MLIRYWYPLDPDGFNCLVDGLIDRYRLGGGEGDPLAQADEARALRIQTPPS
jgi:hypothetical protein